MIAIFPPGALKPFKIITNPTGKHELEVSHLGIGIRWEDNWIVLKEEWLSRMINEFKTEKLDDLEEVRGYYPHKSKLTKEL